MKNEDKEERQKKFAQEKDTFVRNQKLHLKDVLFLIAVAAWSIAVVIVEHPVRQVPPIVSYLTFTGFQLR